MVSRQSNSPVINRIITSLVHELPPWPIDDIKKKWKTFRCNFIDGRLVNYQSTENQRITKKTRSFSANNCSLANKQKNGEMCLAPIFLPELATEVFFSFNGQILIYFDSLTGKLSTKLSWKSQLTVNGFLLWHLLFYDFYYPVKFIKNNSDNSNDNNDSTTDE